MVPFPPANQLQIILQATLKIRNIITKEKRTTLNLPDFWRKITLIQWTTNDRFYHESVQQLVQK